MSVKITEEKIIDQFIEIDDFCKLLDDFRRALIKNRMLSSPVERDRSTRFRLVGTDVQSAFDIGYTGHRLLANAVTHILEVIFAYANYEDKPKAIIQKMIETYP